ncbi:hypothetical protein E4U47_002349 [Claviceps purpurea]|nr:hypothetical protein E4U38_002926 [Claviceps purpurea]KAG6165975.1 hypothetical protein E4U11_008564 [Claviceps purpurea]KAG6171523.1 hypothetical protein E4U51_008459 [Claviceps purpurea]KAG6200430.1 hypothetical protein E4U10_002548 [Claviceps purpurea]KAG6272734.1 hypothetical protein E4U47_002349 [Claviceps purpurea]
MYSRKHDSTNGANSVSDGSTIRPRKRLRLIDNEAQDLDEQCSSEDRVRNGDPATRSAFPQFMQLPPELRQHIWCFYCPDLSGKPRVLEFTLKKHEAIRDRLDKYSLAIDPTVISQTKSLRAVFSTHRDSRSIAARVFPDALALDMGSRRAIVRFRKEKDVVCMTDLISDVNYIPPNFATEVQNLAVEQVQDFSEENVYYDETIMEVIPAIKGMFPNLKSLYGLWLVQVASGFKPADRWWRKFINEYTVETYDRETGIGKDTRSLFSWPDLDAHPQAAQWMVAPTLCSFEEMEELGLNIWTMLKYEMDDSYPPFGWNPLSANAGHAQGSSNS